MALVLVQRRFSEGLEWLRLARFSATLFVARSTFFQLDFPWFNFDFPQFNSDSISVQFSIAGSSIPVQFSSKIFSMVQFVIFRSSISSM